MFVSLLRLLRVGATVGCGFAGLMWGEQPAALVLLILFLILGAACCIGIADDGTKGPLYRFDPFW
jgi:hypothetical protein